MYMNADQLFSAGTDSTRITLSSMVGLVMERPEIQRKMHAELDDVLGYGMTRKSINKQYKTTCHSYVCIMIKTVKGDSGRVTLRLKDQLSYTNAVLHESMRYHTILPMGIPHLVNNNTIIGSICTRHF